MKIIEFVKKFNNTPSSLLLLLLLSADCTFIMLNIIQIIFFNQGNILFSIKTDLGYPEIYQYIKWCWIVIILLFISWINRSLSYLVWCLVYFFLLADDATRIHERVGNYISGKMEVMSFFSLRMQDYGELVVVVVSALFFGFLVLLAYLHGNSAFRKMSHDLLMFIIILFFFGVVLDIGKYVLQIGLKSRAIIGFIEDAGEMFTASLTLWYVFFKSIQDKGKQVYLCEEILHLSPNHKNSF